MVTPLFFTHNIATKDLKLSMTNCQIDAKLYTYHDNDCRVRRLVVGPFCVESKSMYNNLIGDSKLAL